MPRARMPVLAPATNAPPRVISANRDRARATGAHAEGDAPAIAVNHIDIFSVRGARMAPGSACSAYSGITTAAMPPLAHFQSA